MKSFISILLVAVALLIFVNIWDYAGGSNIEKRNRAEYEGTVAPGTADSEPVFTAETSEAVTESEPVTTPAVTEAPVAAARDKVILLFGGDLNLDPKYSTVELYTESERNIENCFSKEVLELMNKADIFMLGNVFTFTESEEPFDKIYTFRTAPKNVSFLNDIGADVVSIANNHIFDYNSTGLADTKNILADSGIASVGAGLNIAEASKPYYIEKNGVRIAFTAAMRSEKYIDTPEATETNAGVMKMYTLDAYTEVIREAAENSDFVVAYAHWGTENSIELEEEQISGAKALIDAGADVVIGAHTHTVQAVEYYNGKPIFYSLGDLYSDDEEKESGLARLIINPDDSIDVSFIPCSNIEGFTDIASADISRSIIERLNLSETVTVSKNGTVTEK